MINLRVLAASAAVLSLTSSFVSEAAANGEVNVYTYRETKLIQPLFDAFSKDTGIKVNVVSASSGLEQRMKAEGANSPADVLLTVDIGRIDEAVQAGVTQPIKSEVVDKVVPAQYRDPDGHWAGISMRARVIYASKDRVKQDKITYEELADPKWKGKICIRSGQHIYNNALFAAYTAKYGEAKAEEWLRGVKANLAQKPSGGDREAARDVAAGKCDIGIGNTYYWALMMNNDPEKKPWAEATRVILPTFEGGGTHVNLLRRVARQERAQQGQRHQADRVARERAGAADVCRPELRISGSGRCRRQLHHRGLRQARPGSVADRKDRRQPQGCGLAGGQGRL